MKLRRLKRVLLTRKFVKSRKLRQSLRLNANLVITRDLQLTTLERRLVRIVVLPFESFLGRHNLLVRCVVGQLEYAKEKKVGMRRNDA
jgi:hypothetical protein